MTPEERSRLRKVLRAALLLLCLGLVYGLVLVPLGWVLPCPFHLLTGLQCPGCGITRACTALLHGHLREAYGYNRGLFWALPLLLPALGLGLYRYIRGSRAGRRSEQVLHVLCGILIGWLVLWGILRNLLHL